MAGNLSIELIYYILYSVYLLLAHLVSLERSNGDEEVGKACGIYGGE